MDRVDITRILPEECIGRIISATSPPDACRLSLVSRVFRSAATSNLVWERFLPPEYEQIISEAVSTSSLPLSTLPKKDLFFHLCDNPILIGDGNMNFAMDKLYGKKCYMLAAREIAIIWGDDPLHWKWIPSVGPPFAPKSRFSEVAYLVDVRYLDLQGKIESKMLSSNTTYGAYFVYTLATPVYGFRQPVKVSVRFQNGLFATDTTNAYLQYRKWIDRAERGEGQTFPRRREDMWMEIEMGEIFIGKVDRVVEMPLREIEVLNSKSGLVIMALSFDPNIKERNWRTSDYVVLYLCLLVDYLVLVLRHGLYVSLSLDFG